jgi:VWFA-related protein
VAALCGAFLLAPVLFGPAARAQSFGEEISIVEVEIPVHVLRDGEPVAGLAAEDFVVLDDGEPREVVGFRVIDLTRVEPASGEVAAVAGPGAPPRVEPEGRSILILFDFLFSRRHYLERSLEGAREMVGRLHPADRVAVAFLSETGAEILLGFTRDPREIGLALDVVAAILDAHGEEARELLAELARLARPGGGEGGAAGSMFSVPGSLTERFGAAAAVTILGGRGASGQGVGFAMALGPGAEAFFDIEGSRFASGTSAAADGDPTLGQLIASSPEAIGASFAADSESGAIHTLASEVGRLATLLRGVPGQKQILYLSEGFGTGLLEAPGTRTLILRDLETHLFEALRGGGWTLHAIDVEGVPSPFAGADEWGAVGAPNPLGAPAGGPGFDAEALFVLSNETGGMLFENFNRTSEATGRLLDRTRITYVLTIRSGELSADGRLHRLAVRLAEPEAGTRLFHRTGYYAPKPGEQKSDLERRMDTADLLLGGQEIEELGARLRAGALPPVRGLAPIPVVLEVPGEGLLGGRERGTIDLDIQLYAVDARDGVQDLWLRSLELDLDKVGSTLARGGLRVLGGLALPPGEYRLRALVRERTSGRTSLFTTPLTVPADGGGLLPHDPMAIDRSGDWVQLVALPAGPGGAPSEVFAMGRALVVPPVDAVLAEGQALDFLVVTSGGDEIELSVRLLDAQGRRVVVSEAAALVAHQTSGRGPLVRHLARAATDGLAPGSYLLEVSASGPGGVDRVSRSLSLEVRQAG